MHAPDKNASDQPLPGSVSDQNAEEAEPGHDDTAGGHGGSKGPPTRDEDSGSGSGGESREGSGSGGESREGSGSGGESGEGSQSTGNPASAG